MSLDWSAPSPYLNDTPFHSLLRFLCSEPGSVFVMLRFLCSEPGNVYTEWVFINMHLLGRVFLRPGPVDMDSCSGSWGPKIHRPRPEETRPSRWILIEVYLRSNQSIMMSLWELFTLTTSSCQYVPGGPQMEGVILHPPKPNANPFRIIEGGPLLP